MEIVEAHIFNDIEGLGCDSIIKVMDRMINNERFNSGKIFGDIKYDDYLWEIGAEIAAIIKRDRIMFCPKYNDIGPKEILGIRVSSDPAPRYNRYGIRLKRFDYEPAINFNFNATHDLDTLIKSINKEHKRYSNILHGGAAIKTTKNLIRNVIFNDPATIVFWNDGTKTVVKAENEPFDPEKGLAMAIAKKFFGNEGNYYDIFREWLPEKED